MLLYKKYLHPNPAIVSFKLTNLPFLPENTSLIKNGYDKNFYTFLALETVNLSSSDNSSIPKIAIISYNDL
jgi:hypothetical protein